VASSALNRSQHVVKQHAGTPDEGLTLPIILLTGRFTDHHNGWLCDTLTHNRLLPGRT
jgi:hypothetical protein